MRPRQPLRQSSSGQHPALLRRAGRRRNLSFELLLQSLPGRLSGVHVARYRERRSPSGAKSDAADAHLLAFSPDGRMLASLLAVLSSRRTQSFGPAPG